MANRTDDCVYSLNGVQIYNIEGDDSEQIVVKIKVNPPYPHTLSDFMDRIHVPFVLWGREHGLVLCAGFRFVELTRLTTDGVICNYIADPPLTRNDWEQNWSILRSRINLAIEANDESDIVTVNCTSLEILSHRQPITELDTTLLHSTTSDNDN